MLTLPPSVRIFVAAGATDMRCSFDGLSMRVRDVLKHDPLCGHLFVFFNKRKDQARILFWDRHGFCIVAKRLECGTFKCASVQTDATHIEMEAAELTLILEGIDLRQAKRRTRWRGVKAIQTSDNMDSSQGMPILSM